MVKPRKSHFSGIPIPFLIQMGNHEIELDGVKIVVHVVDCAAGVEKRIAEMRFRLQCSTKVVGIECKEMMNRGGKILVLCALNRALIIHLGYVHNACDAPESLDEFLSDPKICFVGLKLPEDVFYAKCSNVNTAVKAGDLAARVLKKPGLSSLSLPDLANEVGVSYEGPASKTAGFEVDLRKLNVFTEEDVVNAVTDAFAFYQIGYKLLTSL